ncbi:MAG: Asp-tRNA(Asn)/Glu-tRNA(Gln) amidotransferase subunit GatC [Lentisphaeria bacterium]|nr:Asp-tRNA(Asn)/Glu-tRNA(Gln) amidotransferase subunit GatC [Lentisphaeria bacterium]NQZ70425.1 Asp-tRNA(Asn)/Glu-tRNA(Gln) amidotransferase subunit GatC [Lentisphaeria bacterium]
MANKIDVDHIAKLARLTLTDEERERFQREIGAIVSYLDILQEIDTEGVEPTAHANPLGNVIREDVPGTCQDIELTLKNAPEHEDNEIVVPAIINDEGA